jgi:hypothetical protein
VGAAAPQTRTLRIKDVAVKAYGDTLQVVVAASGTLTYKTFQVSTPPRLVIDIPNARIDDSVASVIEVAQGGIARVRIGQFQTRPAVARIAVDMTTVVPFTLATETPGVLVAKFATKGNLVPAAAPVTPGATSAVSPVAPVFPAQAPAQPVAQAPAPPVQVAQAPAPTPTPAAPGPQPTQAPAGSRVSFEFRNIEIADVLSAVARVCNLNLVTDSSVKGTITVRLLDLTCDEAFRYILDANNLGFRRLGRNLIIMAAEKLAPPPEMPEAITYSVAFGTAKSIADAIRAAVPGIRVTNEDRINAVVVTGTKAQHEEVRKVMTSLDVQLLNYSVEARVVDINKQDLQQLGLNWGLTGAPFVGVVGTTNPFAQVTVDVNFNIRATLDALVTQRRARVISAPRIGVLDGNEASVNLGEEIPIPSIDASGRLTFTFRPVGVNLRILPRANRDNLITVRLEPEVSTVREFLPTPSGPVPRLTTRKAATTITVRNGQSIIIGGLIAAEERRTTIKVPLLGDIPIIGALFRTTTTDRQETEVIFVVTPQILPSGDR